MLINPFLPGLYMQNDKNFKTNFNLKWGVEGNCHKDKRSTKFDATFDQGIRWSRPTSENQFAYYEGQDVVPDY